MSGWLARVDGSGDALIIRETSDESPPKSPFIKKRTERRNEPRMRAERNEEEKGRMESVVSS